MTIAPAQAGGSAFGVVPAGLAMFIGWTGEGSGAVDSCTLNAGASGFVGSAPSGYSAWDASGGTTWDSAHKGADITLSGGALSASRSATGSWETVWSTTFRYTGKFYFELACNTLSNGSNGQAIGLGGTRYTGDLIGFNIGSSFASLCGGFELWWPQNVPSGTVAWAAGDHVCVAVDLDNNLIWFRNGASGNWNGSALANPASGVGGITMLRPVSMVNPYVALASAPTAGELLIAAGQQFGGLTTLDDRWTLDASNTSVYTAYRYAVAGEPMAQCLETGVGHFAEWDFDCWALSGASGVWATDHVQTTLNATTNLGPSATPVATSLTTQSATRLVLAAFTGETLTTRTLTGWSAGWTDDGFFISTQPDVSASAFDFAGPGHMAVSGIATVQPTLTFSGSVTTARCSFLEFAGGSSTETGAGAMAFGPVQFAGQTHEPPTSSGAMAFGPVAFNAVGHHEPNAAGALGFGPVAFAGRVPGNAVAALGFGPVNFNAESGRETTAGALAFGPVAFDGAVHVPSIGGGGLAFGPVRFDAGGGARIAEFDVASLLTPEINAQLAELDVAALLVPTGNLSAVIAELDVSVVLTPAVTTGAAISELDIAVLAYPGPCATSRCMVWKITRRDGRVYGFTSLDSDIDYLGVTYRTCKSLQTTAAESDSELRGVGNVELTGILDDSSISDADLYSGLFDDAFVEVWVIPYDGQPDDQAPFRQAAGWIGKVTRGEHNFTADVIGPGARLGQVGIVDVVTPGCRWDFGVLDDNGIGCPVDADALAIVNIAVTGSTLRSLIDFTHADPGEAAIWNEGTIVWQTGRNAGAVCQTETVDFGAGAVSLWDLVPYPPAIGDLFTLKPGCPKIKSACDTYGVYISFGGFDDVPGPDALQSNADSLFT